MRRMSRLVAVPLLLLPAVPARAADDGMPKVLYVEREEIKPGKAGAHGKLIDRLVRFAGKSNAVPDVLAMQAVTGDENSALFLFPFASWGAMEQWFGKFQAAQAASPAEFEAIEKEGGEIHARQRAMIAVHQPELSFHPRGAGTAKMRYMFVSTIRVEAGRVAQFRDEVKWTNSVFEKAGSSRHWSFWWVGSGTEFRTFLRLEAVRSLADVDAWADETKRMADALDPESRKRWDELGREAKPEGWSALYAFDPAHSAVPKAWKELDPDFWVPKPAAGAAPKAARPAKK